MIGLPRVGGAFNHFLEMLHQPETQNDGPTPNAPGLNRYPPQIQRRFEAGEFTPGNE